MPSVELAALRRENLARATLATLNRGNRRNPDVLLVELGERRVVVKDFAPRGALVRATIGRWLTAREIRAYQALTDHPAVPRFLGRIDSLAFVVAYRPGRRLSRKIVGTLRPGFLDDLEQAVRGMHERGVVHLDLRHRSNVLVDGEGRPILIDFASAVCLRPAGLLARLLLPCLARVDRSAVAKWRAWLERQRAAGPAASEPRRGASRPT
jgi:hypothetical protein